MPELPENSVFIETRAQWRTWLETHHTRTEGVWLVYNKKASGKSTVPYAEQVEEALCFGWVDSKGNRLDEERTMLYFAPRKAGSGWARPNKERIERLMAQGLMAPAGLAKIEAAKFDGSWEMLDAVEDLVVPEDLATEFARHPNAAAHFEAFPRSVKRGILEWIVQAKRAETRQKRSEETARLANENIRANQWQK
ncbi:MAG: YdeI/OmpD-associated family protein [Armatimonas sp.]